MIPYSKEAYQLLHDGSITLAKIEANGIRIDTSYLAKAQRRLRRRINRTTEKLETSEILKIWKREYKGATNVDSGQQLGHILFEVMGYTGEKTKHEIYKTDETALAKIDNPFVKDYLQLKKMKKSLTTYLQGIEREVVNGYLHPGFNLNMARTYRSSSDSPNFQNIPIRDPKIAKLIRQAFIARPGRCLVELDYSGIEVCIAACYHQDPTMLEYLEDKTKDMHRDMAMECFRLPLDEMVPSDKRAKQIRYCGKNMFVFPQFYGDWYIDCAKSLWDAIDQLDLQLRDGTSLKEHLRSKGIRERGDCDPREKPRKGTMERHIQQVEKEFWTKRFPIYDRWKKKWVREYNDRGWMKTLTGFICQGWMKRNEIINYPVQGSAFHCLLKSLIGIQDEIEKQKMESLLVGQIHDSVIGDIPMEELDDFLGMAQDVMVRRLKEAWSWINVPLEVEAEVTPVDGNWYQKKEQSIAG